MDPLKVKGWMSIPELEWLEKTAASLKEGLIIEIGIWYGRSTTALCNGAIKSDSRVIAIDHFQGVPEEGGTYSPEDIDNCRESAFEALMEYIDSEILNILTMNSNDAWKQIVEKSADLVFIDGDHSQAQVMRDIMNYVPLLKKGGMISGHDLNHPMSVTKAVETYFGVHYSRVPGTTIWYKRLD